MTPSPPLRLYDYFSQSRDGILSSIYQVSPRAGQSHRIRSDHEETLLGLVKAVPAAAKRPYAWEYIDPTGADITWALGAYDATPYGTNSTWTTPIVSSSVADPTVITTDSPHHLATGDVVSIQRHLGSTPSLNGDFKITVLSDTTFSLADLSGSAIEVTVGGTGGWFAAIRVTQVQTGTSSKPDIQRISILSDAYDGVVNCSFSRAQVVAVTAKQNTGSVKEISTITALADGGVKEVSTLVITAADSGGSFHDTVLATLYDASGPVQILASNGGAIATAIPSGGRRITVSFTNGDAASTIASATKVALDADTNLKGAAAFTTVRTSATLQITDNVMGTRTAFATAHASVTGARSITGVASNRHDTVAALLHDADGPVQLHLSALNSGTASSATSLITVAGHGFVAGQKVFFDTLGTGGGLSTGTVYYVIGAGLTTNDFKVSTTSGGSAVTIGTSYTSLTVAPLEAGPSVTNVTGAPADGRRISVPMRPGMTATELATQVQVALAADSKYSTSSRSGAVVSAKDGDYGARAAAAEAGTSGFAVSRKTAGVWGILHDKYFTITDDGGETVGIYLTQSGADPASEHAVQSLARFFKVTVAAGDTASTVGGAIATAVDADADFTASNASGLVTITNVVSGERTAPSAGTAGMGVRVVYPGLTLTAAVPFTATADDIAALFGGRFLVARRSAREFDITSLALGAQNAWSATGSGLLIPLTLRGTLSLDTAECLAAFIAADADVIAAVEELQVTLPGGEPWTPFQRANILTKDIITEESGTPTTAATFVAVRTDITSLTGGAAGALDSIATAGVSDGKILVIRVPDFPRMVELIRTPIASSSVANPTVITTTRPHGLTTGDSVTIGGHIGSTPSIDGARTVTVTGANTFTIPVNVTVAGTAGYVTPAESTAAGIVRPDDFDAATNAVAWKTVNLAP